MGKETSIWARIFFVIIHFFLPHVFRIGILFVGNIVYSIFIADIVAEIRNFGDFFKFIYQNAEPASFQIVVLIVLVLLIFGGINLIGEKICLFLGSKKLFYIVYSISAIVFLLPLSNVNYDIAGIPRYLDLFLILALMAAYGFGCYKLRLDNNLKKEKHNKKRRNKNLELETFSYDEYFDFDESRNRVEFDNFSGRFNPKKSDYLVYEVKEKEEDKILLKFFFDGVLGQWSGGAHYLLEIRYVGIIVCEGIVEVVKKKYEGENVIFDITKDSSSNHKIILIENSEVGEVSIRCKKLYARHLQAYNRKGTGEWVVYKGLTPDRKE
jgi:hypothetical protein